MKKDPQDSTERPPLNLAGRIWKILLGTLLIIAGSIFVDYLWSSYQRAAIMDAWVKTPCVIETINIDDSQLNQRGVPKYLIEITYTYQFEGQDHTGDRMKRLPVEASDPRKVKAKLDGYEEGVETVCYVDPSNPDMAVLKKDSKAGLYSIWFPCLFVVGGLGIIVTALIRR
ncbi:MAG: DUF3592 domain-containing protein [Verrucomicrobiota bacterium]